MEKFYCREEELRKLNARYENEEFEYNRAGEFGTVIKDNHEL